jgi:hypothetical protein
MANLTSNQLCNICCIHYNAGLRCCALGSLVEGGYLFAKRGGIGWIVACSSRQVRRTWALRADAVTTAQAGNACGDWFIPSRNDLQLAVDCKSFWDTFTNNFYWSSTQCTSSYIWGITPACGLQDYLFFTNTLYVRAFRRVFY